MAWLYFALGALLVLGALIDAVSHTIALRGGGPLARRLGNLLWQGVLRQQHRAWFGPLTTLAGPLILLLTFSLWSLLLWAGWSLIFLADHSGIVDSTTGQAAGVWDRIYYAGFAITTLGIGDYVPRTALYQILTAVAAGLGFFLITLFVTYLLSVLSAVVFKRSLALNVIGLAGTPERLVIDAWHSGRFRSLEQYCLSISKEWVTLSQQHLAYPALHFFRTRHRSGSPSVAAAVMDESLTLLEYGVAPEHRPDPLILRGVRHGIEQLADSVMVNLKRPPEPPPIPSLDALRAAGVPTVDDQAFREAVQNLENRRATLRGLLRYEGRDWDALRDQG